MNLRIGSWTGAILIALAIAASGLAVPSAARAQAAADLAKLSLEDLLSTEVTSVAKKPQRVDEAAAAVFVISQEDIRRSGAVTVPDLLRMVPGLEVAQLPSGGFAVSARGFNGFSSNKLLVLIDGRAIYLSALGGVLWDQQLVPVEDIQRIEVVRGPGATLWGANAVNGVINIVTKHSVDTLGASVATQADSEGGDRVFARFGAQVGASTTVRAYIAQRTIYDHLSGQAGLIDDRAHGLQGGFRIDMQPTQQDAVTLQGDLQNGRNRLSAESSPPGLPGPPPAGLPAAETFDGSNLIGRWTRTFDDHSGFTGEAYWDHVQRQLLGLNGRVDQLNIDFSHHFEAGSRNAIVWGLNYRLTSDATNGLSYLFLWPGAERDKLFGAFVQDDVTIIPNRLTVSLGSKFENSDDSGFDFEPSIRALWRGGADWSVWAAVSRAVRTPSRFEQSLVLQTPQLLLTPNQDTVSEKMIAYELGLRDQIRPGLALDITVYHQDYDQLISWGAAGFAPPGIPIVMFGNHGHAQNTGVELALDATITPSWTVKVAGNLMSLGINPGGIGSTASSNAIDPGVSPRNQLSVRSLWNVTDNVDADLTYRHVGPLATGPVPAYDDLDLRLAWRPTVHWELSVMGDHLLAARRVEMVDSTQAAPAIVARRATVKLAFRY